MSLVELILSISMASLAFMAIGRWLPEVLRAQSSIDASEEALNVVRILERRLANLVETGNPRVTVSVNPGGWAEAVFIETSPGNNVRFRNVCRPESDKPLRASLLRTAMSSLTSTWTIPPLAGCRQPCASNDQVPVVEILVQTGGSTREDSFQPSEAMENTSGAFFCLRSYRSLDFAGGTRDHMLLHFVSAYDRKVKRSSLPSADSIGWHATSVRLPAPSP